MDYSKKFPPSKITKAKIKALKRINLNKNTNIEVVKREIGTLINGWFPSKVPVIEPGTRLYRGVRWKEEPKFKSNVSYPDPECVTIPYGRANRPGESRFYCSQSYAAIFHELGVNPGESLTISHWEVTDKFIASPIGYSDKVFKKLQSARTMETTWHRYEDYMENRSYNLAADYIYEAFAKHHNDNGIQYIMSTALAECLSLGKINNIDIPNDALKEFKFGGIIYPSIAMWANADNFMLYTEAVDTYLNLKRVDFVKVNTIENQSCTYELLNCSTSWNEKGEIDWKKGMPLQWHLEAGTHHISNENGVLIIKNDEGQVIDPS